MSAHLEPDVALAKWREQIDEHNRQLQINQDQREQIEELARLNAEFLFQAQHYKAIADAKAAEAEHFLRWVNLLRARCDALAVVAGDVAKSIVGLATMAQDAAGERPAPITIAMADPPKSIDEAAARVADAIIPRTTVLPPDQMQDNGEAVPAFLTEPLPQLNVTPLPEVRP